jgi:Fungal hydrophobin
MIVFIVAEPAGSVGEFKSICSATGKSAACCFVPAVVQPLSHTSSFLSLTKMNSLALTLFATRCKGILSKIIIICWIGVERLRKLKILGS